jgi:hypothetical protein
MNAGPDGRIGASHLRESADLPSAQVPALQRIANLTRWSFCLRRQTCIGGRAPSLPKITHSDNLAADGMRGSTALGYRAGKQTGLKASAAAVRLLLGWPPAGWLCLAVRPQERGRGSRTTILVRPRHAGFQIISMVLYSALSCEANGM